MIEKNIEEHIESKVEKDESIDIHRVSTIEDSLRRTTRVRERRKSIWGEKEWGYLFQEVSGLIEDIPRIKS